MKLFAAVLILGLPLVSAAADKTWTRFQSCKYVADKNNDGDSFLVRCGKEEFYARFYFIDAPESNNSAPQRVQEQYDFFGVSMDELTRAGSKANDYVYRTLSARPFVLYTKRASAQGRAKTVRYYSLIEVDGRYLHEILVSEGLARVKGTSTTLPNEQKGRAHAAHLKKLEEQARIGRKGVWATSVESKRKSPL